LKSGVENLLLKVEKVDAKMTKKVSLINCQNGVLKIDQKTIKNDPL
jgi:phage/plasmid-associated DNA primase